MLKATKMPEEEMLKAMKMLEETLKAKGKAKAMEQKPRVEDVQMSSLNENCSLKKI